MSHSDEEKASNEEIERVAIGEGLVFEKVHDAGAIKDVKAVQSVQNGSCMSLKRKRHTLSVSS